MLETVKLYLKNGPCIDLRFHEFFVNYVCKMQDALIEQEVSNVEHKLGYNNYLELIKVIGEENISK